MSVEEGGLECFGEVVGHVDSRVDSFEYHEVSLDPIAEQEIFYIDVTCTGGGFLCIAHSCASVIVLIEKGGCFLWYVKVPEDAANIEYRFTRITSRHKFCLGTRAGDCGLEAAFVGNGSTGKSDTDASKGPSRLGACGPV